MSDAVYWSFSLRKKKISSHVDSNLWRLLVCMTKMAEFQQGRLHICFLRIRRSISCCVERNRRTFFVVKVRDKSSFCVSYIRSFVIEPTRDSAGWEATLMNRVTGGTGNRWTGHRCCFHAEIFCHHGNTWQVLRSHTLFLTVVTLISIVVYSKASPNPHYPQQPLLMNCACEVKVKGIEEDANGCF